MKFMLMMQGTREGWESMGSWSPAELEAHIGFMNRFLKTLRESGELVLAEGLDLPANAKIVRAQGTGPAAITDGPFPEAKEFLAGFWIVDCEGPERAIEIARQASGAPGPGGAPLNIPIEVRRVPDPPPAVDR